MLDYIKEKLKGLDDIFFRTIYIDDERVDVIFNEALVDTSLISDFVIRSIVNEIKYKENNESLNLEQKIRNNLGEDLDIPNFIAINKVKKIDVGKENVFTFILSGFTTVIYNDEVYVFETKAKLTRSITEPTSETTIRGAKDSFIENIMVNVGLIRNRIKTETLCYNEMKIGRKTRTKVGLMYISDVARKKNIDYVVEKLNKIDIDGILDTNYIQEYIEEDNDTEIPITISTQRPDVVSYYLLQGRIAILVDNTPFVLVLPAFFEDFINNIEDMYQKSRSVTFTKVLRYISLFLTIVTPAFYLSIITFDQETIPSTLLHAFAVQREGVPFPAFIESIIMIFAFEILRESDMRSNKVSGNTLSIVGALILGDAAVSAGIVSPIMIIVVAITTISELIFSDINLINAFRKWRIVYMLFASLCGIVGMGVVSVLFVMSFVSTKSYDFPFTYPFSPLNFTTLKKNLFVRRKIPEDNTREKILTDNLTRSR